MLTPSKGILKNAAVSSLDNGIGNDFWHYVKTKPYESAYNPVVAPSMMKAFPTSLLMKLNHGVPLFNTKQWGEFAESGFVSRGRILECSDRHLYPIREDLTDEQKTFAESGGSPLTERHRVGEKTDEVNALEMFRKGQASSKSTTEKAARRPRGNVSFKIDQTGGNQNEDNETGNGHSRSSALKRNESSSLMKSNYLPKHGDVVHQVGAVERVALNGEKAAVPRGNVHLKNNSIPESVRELVVPPETEVIPVPRADTPYPQMPMFVRLRNNALKGDGRFVVAAKHGLPPAKENKNVWEGETGGRVKFKAGQQELGSVVWREITSDIEEDLKLSKSKEATKKEMETRRTVNPEKRNRAVDKNESSDSLTNSEQPANKANINKRALKISPWKDEKPAFVDSSSTTKSKPPTNDFSAMRQKATTGQGIKPKSLTKLNTMIRAEARGMCSAGMVQKDSPKEISRSIKRGIQLDEMSAVESKLAEQVAVTGFPLNKNPMTVPSTKRNISMDRIPVKSSRIYSQNSRPSFDEESTKCDKENMVENTIPLEQICSRKLSEIGNKSHERERGELKLVRSFKTVRGLFLKDRNVGEEDELSCEVRGEVQSPEKSTESGTTEPSEDDQLNSSAVPPDLVPRERADFDEFATDRSHSLMNEKLVKNNLTDIPGTRIRTAEEATKGPHPVTRRKSNQNYLKTTKKAQRTAESRPRNGTLRRNITSGRKQNAPPFPKSALPHRRLKNEEENSLKKTAAAKVDSSRNPNRKQSKEERNLISELLMPTVNLKPSTSSKCFVLRKDGTRIGSSPEKIHDSARTATESNLRGRQNNFSPKKELFVSNVTVVPKLSGFRSKLETTNRTPSYKPSRKTLTKNSKNLSTDENIGALIPNRDDSTPGKVRTKLKRMVQKKMKPDLRESVDDVTELVEGKKGLINDNPKVISETKNPIPSREFMVHLDAKQPSAVSDKKQNGVGQSLQSSTEGTLKNILPIISLERLKSLPSEISSREITQKEVKQSKSESVVSRKGSLSDVVSKNYPEHSLPSIGDGNSQVSVNETAETNREEIPKTPSDIESNQVDLWKKRVEELLNKKLVTAPSFDWYLSGRVQESASKIIEQGEPPVKSASEKLAEIGARLAEMQRQKAAAVQPPEETEKVEPEIDTVAKWQKATDCFYKEHTKPTVGLSDTDPEEGSFAGNKSFAESKSRASLRITKTEKSKRHVKNSNNKTRKGKVKQKENNEEIHLKSDTTNWTEKIRPGLSDMNMAFLIQMAASLSKNMYDREQRQNTLVSNNQQTVVSQTNKLPDKRRSTQGVNESFHRLNSDGRTRTLNASQTHGGNPVRVPPPGRRTFIDAILYPGYRTPPPTARGSTTLIKPSASQKNIAIVPAPKILPGSPLHHSYRSRSIKVNTPKKKSSKNHGLKGKPSASGSLLPTKEADPLIFPNNRPVELETGTWTSMKATKPRRRRNIRKTHCIQVRPSSALPRSGRQSTLPPSPSKNVARMPLKRTKRKKSPAKEQKVQFFKKQFQIFAKCGDRRNTGNTITLVNTKKWLKQAGLIDQKKITGNDVETYFLHHTGRLRSLPLVDFLQFLRTLASEKNLSVLQITEQLLNCGTPSANTADMEIAAMFEDPQKVVSEETAPGTSPPKCVSSKRRKKQNVATKERHDHDLTDVETLVQITSSVCSE